MSDEHNARMLGAAGHPLVQTPNLDALAAGGTRFSHAYCNSPICVPSRASFATGRYAHDIGAWDNAAPYTGQAPSWGHRLTAAGHHVTTIGKLHYRNTTDDLGFPDQRLPIHVMHERGDLFGLIRAEIPATRHLLEQIQTAGPGESEYIRYDAAIADAGVRWLGTEARHHERPWCLFVSFTLPHFPLIVPAAYFERYAVEDVPLPIRWQPADWPRHPHLEAFRAARVQTPDEHLGERAIRRAIAAYYGMCTFLDHQIGRVLAALEQSGQSDRTRVIYTSDHGEMLGDYGCWGKSTMYDSATAVPLIVAGPDIPAGGLVQQNVSLVDCFPSILDALGLAPQPADADLPGRSLWPAARGDDFPHRSIFAEYHATGSPSAAYMLRGDRFKYAHYVDYPPQLFDLAVDPEERHDLAAQLPSPLPDGEISTAGHPASRRDGSGPTLSEGAGRGVASDPPLPEGEGRGVKGSRGAESPRAILARMESELRGLIDPEALDRAAKADQLACMDANGGEAAIRAIGPQISFTRAPEQYR